MKRLNEAAEPHLAQFAQGNWPILSQDQRKAVAAWLTMLTMSYEFHDLETMASRQVDRQFLMDHQAPPAHWTVMIGRHRDSSEWRERINHTGIGFWSPQNQPQGALRDRFRDNPNANFQITVSTFGQIVFNTLSVHSDAVDIISMEKAVFNATIRGMRVLWPIVSHPLSEPNRILSDGDIDVLANEAFRTFGGCLLSAGWSVRNASLSGVVFQSDNSPSRGSV